MIVFFFVQRIVMRETRFELAKALSYKASELFRERRYGGTESVPQPCSFDRSDTPAGLFSIE